jgi:hypothetical protein
VITDDVGIFRIIPPVFGFSRMSSGVDDATAKECDEFHGLAKVVNGLVDLREECEY